LTGQAADRSTSQQEDRSTAQVDDRLTNPKADPSTDPRVVHPIVQQDVRSTGQRADRLTDRPVEDQAGVRMPEASAVAAIVHSIGLRAVQQDVRSKVGRRVDRAVHAETMHRRIQHHAHLNSSRRLA
jgi:hypothetical protein